jgi:MFS superfamily sulfate permease-like transporter
MIAYASLAGLPPQAGLYTLLASLGLYAVFGTGRQLVVAGTSASAGLGLAGHGVKVIGTIPTGLPAVSWPHLRLDDLWVLLPSAAAMMLVIFSEALGAG